MRSRLPSTSPPEPSASRPPGIPSGATPREKRAVALGVSLVCLTFALYTVGVNDFIKSLTIEQVNIAMPLIVQLDSFLTGGWVIGFFYYWGGWEEALRESKRSRKELLKTSLAKLDLSGITNLHQAMLRREKELAPTSKIYIELVLGVVMFIISAITAVFAVLTYTIIMVQLSLEFLAGGALVMTFSWVVLRYITQRLRELTDIVLEFRD